MQLPELAALYPSFRSTYQTHIQKAGFDDVLQRNSYFASRKLRLIAIRSILDKNRPLLPEMRYDLIRSVLFEGNFVHAQKILTKVEEKNLSIIGARGIGSRIHGSAGSEDTLKKDMKSLAASVSDSQFLRDIKNIEDKEMRTVIKEVDDLVYEQLDSSISKIIRTMTPVVLDMQQQRCWRSMQDELESQERNLLRGVLTEFIRDINARSVGRGDS
jgi:hypothetical protein